jgi:hypothetical protein
MEAVSVSAPSQKQVEHEDCRDTGALRKIVLNAARRMATKTPQALYPSEACLVMKSFTEQV